MGFDKKKQMRPTNKSAEQLARERELRLKNRMLKTKEREKQLEQARKQALELLEDQARARFDALTMTSEEARAAADLALIRELDRAM